MNTELSQVCVSSNLWTLISTEAMDLYDPQLCYILDGFLGIYGLIITGMFIKEKVGLFVFNIYWILV